MKTSREGVADLRRDPLTRPAAAGKCTATGHPLPQGGEGCYLIRAQSTPQHSLFAVPPVTRHLLLVTALCVAGQGEAQPFYHSNKTTLIVYLAK